MGRINIKIKRYNELIEFEKNYQKAIEELNENYKLAVKELIEEKQAILVQVDDKGKYIPYDNGLGVCSSEPVYRIISDLIKSKEELVKELRITKDRCSKLTIAKEVDNLKYCEVKLILKSRDSARGKIKTLKKILDEQKEIT